MNFTKFYFESDIDSITLVFYTVNELNIDLQGRVRFPTGGIAHEPQGMIRCNSEADSIVWMEEDVFIYIYGNQTLSLCSEFFCIIDRLCPGE